MLRRIRENADLMNCRLYEVDYAVAEYSAICMLELH